MFDMSFLLTTKVLITYNSTLHPTVVLAVTVLFRPR